MNNKDAFIHLGKWIEGDDPALVDLIGEASRQNPWFTTIYVHQALKAIRTRFLAEEEMDSWLDSYGLTGEETRDRRVALVLAGNIPLVGFHDVMCVVLAGYQAVIKLSDKDAVLLPGLIQKMSEWHPDIQNRICFVDRLTEFDAVIATGSNQSASYFHKYFSQYPHIIRKNRNAIAILTGKETEVDLINLGLDIFSFFGLGCRNVSKIYVPFDYDFIPLLQRLNEFKSIADHSKYKNNYDYHLATAIINQEQYMSNDCLILLENSAIASKVAVLQYEFYHDLEFVKNQIEQHNDQIQCVIGKLDNVDTRIVPFGDGQNPSLHDYADGINTMEFLCSLL